MCEPRKENLGQLGTAAIFWLITRAFFSMLPRLRLSFSLQITLPNHRDQKKASDHEDDPHVRGSHELHHRHENESLDDHDQQYYLDLEAQDQTIDHDPKWDRRSHAQKKEEAVMMTLRPLTMEAIMVPYSRSGGLIITDSLSFPRYDHFKNSSFCIGESSSRSVSNGNDDKSSFSLSTSTTTTTGSTTSNSSLVSSPLSSSSKYGRKPVLPKDYSPNSTKLVNLRVNVGENDQNQTRSPLHDPLTTRHNIFQKQELSKQLFAVAVGFLPGIFILHHSDPQTFNWFICSVIALFIGVGVGFLWNGNVLQEDYPIYAHWIQMLGYALVLGAFFCSIARFLWPEKYLFPIPLVCYAISLVILGIKLNFLLTTL